ncbi:MAG: PDZ domain-containing protein [Polyangiaceae bacterium]
MIFLEVIRLSRSQRHAGGVTIRRRVGVALFALTLSAPTWAQSAPGQGEAARSAAQAARTAANAADQAADASLDGITDHDGAPKSKVEKARDGVVTLERGGKVLGLGTVLAGDGRILTALSPLGHGNNVDARFADGSVARVKVGHTDRAWDLALLIPQNGRWKKGLRASRSTATDLGSQLRTYSVISAKELAPARTIIKGARTLVGGDNELLNDALELSSRLKSTDVGSPILDDKGDVVAVVARACAPVPNQNCARVPYGVPTPAIKAFLRTVPANAVPPAPWLGIQGAAEDSGPARGVRVLSVHPRSSAAAAGLKGGRDASKSDVIVAIDGVPVLTPEALADAINRRAVGDSVELLILGGGKYRRATLSLQPGPQQAKARPVSRPKSPTR